MWGLTAVTLPKCSFPPRAKTPSLVDRRYYNDLDFLQIGYKALDDQALGRPLLADHECALSAPKHRGGLKL